MNLLTNDAKYLRYIYVSASSFHFLMAAQGRRATWTLHIYYRSLFISYYVILVYVSHTISILDWSDYWSILELKCMVTGF